jgi:hypothetical protein
MTIVPKSVLAEHATAIRQLGKRVVADVIEIGCRLADCRDNHLEHGQWLPWLKKEFGWTDRTARNFINVYEQSKLEKFSDLNLPVSSLYLLCAPSTPEEHRKIILERAGAGEEIKRAEIKRGNEAAKAAKPAKRKKRPPTEDDFQKQMAAKRTTAVVTTPTEPVARHPSAPDEELPLLREFARFVITFKLIDWAFWQADTPAPEVQPVPLPPAPSPSPSAKPVAAITTRKADTSAGMDDEIPF